MPTSYKFQGVMRCEIPESRLLAAKFGAKSRQEFEFPGRHWKPVHSIKRAWGLLVNLSRHCALTNQSEAIMPIKPSSTSHLLLLENLLSLAYHSHNFPRGGGEVVSRIYFQPEAA